MQAMKRYVGPEADPARQEARATWEAVRPPHVCSESSGNLTEPRPQGCGRVWQ